ncbi:MAG: histidine kinase [Bacteroidetes bacterium]|nr:histidine kinase [Bacteroidota bacterium]
MDSFLFRRIGIRKQYFISILFIAMVASISYLFSNIIGYRVVAFLLLVTVSFLAMFLDIVPVLIAACLSAITWNFFFIPPRFTFAIHNAEDLFLFLMYFIIALLNGVLTFKIRQMEKKAKEKTERENTLKLYNTLLNSLSHELRTPIATIIGATDNLNAMADKLTEINKHELLNEITKASIRLDRQVGNLLNMSRLESGFIKPKYDWFDVNELVHDVANQISDQFHGKPLNISIRENLPLFKLDYGLLSQVLHNLLHNAMTHIPKYAVVTVRAGCKENKLLLIVEDTGHGFPVDEMDKVFEKFYRLRNSSPGGTGLGLSIVKGFVEAMNGTIRIENMTDGGAVFTIEIPSELSYLNGSKT